MKNAHDQVMQVIDQFRVPELRFSTGKIEITHPFMPESYQTEGSAREKNMSSVDGSETAGNGS
ncbi:MAG: hypothetical protein CMJ95_11315 [Planctomycetes bacterium]|nr:hypothetical protein [Planctomycetota bacterium]